MKSIIVVFVFGLFAFWIVMIPSIMILKIKYFKRLNRKEYKGTEELFLFLSSEWVIAGLTWAIPIFGRDKDTELIKIRGEVNSRLYLFYSIILIQLILAGVLSKMA